MMCMRQFSLSLCQMQPHTFARLKCIDQYRHLVTASDGEGEPKTEVDIRPILSSALQALRATLSHVLVSNAMFSSDQCPDPYPARPAGFSGILHAPYWERATLAVPEGLIRKKRHSRLSSSKQVLKTRTTPGDLIGETACPLDNGLFCRGAWRVIAPAYCYEQAAFVRQCPNPAKLREPSFRPPVVAGVSKKIFRVLCDQRTGVCADVGDIILAEPTLHFGKSMAVFLGVPILITHPGQAPRSFVFAIAEHRIERNYSIPSQSRNQAAQPMWQTCEYIVETEHNHPARSRKLHDLGK